MKEAAWIFGVMATIAGWAWLAFGAGVSVGMDGYSPKVYNVHRGAMAEQLCMLGYSFMLIGAILTAAESIVARLGPVNTSPAIKRAPALEPITENGSIDLTNLPLGNAKARKVNASPLRGLLSDTKNS